MYSRQNVWLFYVAMAITIVCIIALGCCPGVRRTFPMNFIFLGIFVSPTYLLPSCTSRIVPTCLSWFQKDKLAQFEAGFL